MIEMNNLSLDVVMNGLYTATKDAATLLDPPVDAQLIMCFVRHRHPESEVLKNTPALPKAQPNEAYNVLKQVIDEGHLHKIIGVGLDSTEVGNPVNLFADVFALAREHGLRCVSHAGEEGPASNVVDALDILHASRIDHGVRCVEDPAVARRVAMSGIPLTVCPCSNHQLQVNRRFFGGENPVRQLMEAGLKICLNSDDPAYFFGHTDKFGEEHDGYVNACYFVTAKEVGLSADELVVLGLNSFESSFITHEQLAKYKMLLRRYCEDFEP
jgi:adenosine deaminase